MEVLKYCSLFCLSLFLFLACTNPPDYPIEPVIEYVGANKNIVHQGIAGNPKDTVNLIFSFTDGDGDLGSQDSINIFLTDSRSKFEEFFKIPLIPNQGTGKGITGEIIVRLPNQIYFCCTFPNTTNTCFRNAEFPTDTVSYTIQIKDRAGNYSNKIQTEVLTLICN